LNLVLLDLFFSPLHCLPAFFFCHHSPPDQGAILPCPPKFYFFTFFPPTTFSPIPSSTPILLPAPRTTSLSPTGGGHRVGGEAEHHPRRVRHLGRARGPRANPTPLETEVMPMVSSPIPSHVFVIISCLVIIIRSDLFLRRCTGIRNSSPFRSSNFRVKPVLLFLSPLPCLLYTSVPSYFPSFRWISNLIF